MSSPLIPAPLIIEPSGHWIGIDGNWSSFEIEVGTPAQPFFVLPGTGSNVIWVPLPEGCSNSSQSIRGCGTSRGVGASSGPENDGFNTNASNTWDQIGLYGLPVDQGLFYEEQNGLYGLESVALGESHSPRLIDQAVAGVSSVEFWVGSVGLAAERAEFPGSGKSVSSILSSLKISNSTPSLSYGYFAGAHYRNSSARLVLGGFDEAAFEPSDLSLIAENGSLSVNLHSLVVTNSLIGTMSAPLGETGLSMVIDSVYSDLWLPPAICDSLSDALNLTLDLATGWYLIDSATHNNLVQSSPEFTFTLAANDSSAQTLNIVLPYSAFDRQLLPPIYDSPVPYFPIRRAPEGSSFILGRTFLQEAYLVVDWERKNFTLGQARTDGGPPGIVPIFPPRDIQSATGSLDTGAIAGIVIGAVAVFISIAAVFWYRRRSRPKKGHPEAQQNLEDNKVGAVLSPQDGGREQWPEDGKKPSELDGKEGGAQEVYSKDVQELHGETARQQLMSEPVFELDSGFRPHELESPVAPKTR